MLGYKSLLISVTLASFITLIFIPLKNIIQSFIEKYFFMGNFFQLAEQNEQLRREIVQSERLKSIAILASGMAHEIKNPLTVLKTFSEFLPRKMDDKEFLKKFQPMIAHEIDRINALVHELLDFAKPAPLQIKPTPIHALLDQTLEILSNDFLKHKINVHKDYSLTTPAILNLDPNQFKQALLNILLNAMEAMPTGGAVTVTTLPSSDLQYALIKIQDTGCGIRNEDIAHIFDPFFTKKDHGTGLGLSITYEIVRGHQGKIFAESEKDRGTAFVIELPL
ncbi:MAG: ATP-binding protein [Candidatus Omnitrophota bacterium]|nr:ATP-binding protein [Candidatus Omnitrophota bacterium]